MYCEVNDDKDILNLIMTVCVCVCVCVRARVCLHASVYFLDYLIGQLGGPRMGQGDNHA